MRLAIQQTDVIQHDGQIIGVNLGFDFAAEHEWGFKWAARYLGRPIEPIREKLGVAARTTTTVNPEFSVELLEHDGALWLRGQQAWRNQYSTLADDLKPGAGSYNMQALVAASRNRPLVAGWDTDHGFCIAGKTDEAKRAIQIVHDALIAGRCFILQSGGIFGAGGLKFIDAALIPADVDEGLCAADTSSLSLKDAVAKTGIRERLEAAGRRYFALSPRWTDETKGEFQFWLNPQEQDRNNFGWFKLADLEAWIADKGPIPKSRAASKARVG